MFHLKGHIRKHQGKHQGQSQGPTGERGKVWEKTFIMVPTGRHRRGESVRDRWAGLNNSPGPSA